MYMYMMKLTAPIQIRIKLAYQARIAMLYRPSKQMYLLIELNVLKPTIKHSHLLTPLFKLE